ncbi:MAG: hypothetical protein AAFR61_08735 [Bacteroidota bacterium]
MEKHLNSFRKARTALWSLLFLSFLSWIGCGDLDALKKEAEEAEKAPTFLILCDLTTSVDASSIDSVAAHAANIFRKLPRPSNAIFLPVEANQFSQELLRHQKSHPQKPSERRAMEKKEEELAVEIEQVIKDRYAKINVELGKKDPARSCIITSISRAQDIIKRAHHSSLLILSDMVVECNTSLLGELYFTERRFKQAQALLENWEPDFDLSKVHKVTIIPSTTGEIQDHGFISSVKLIQTWKEIFRKLNYQGDLHFQPWVPDTL